MIREFQTNRSRLDDELPVAIAIPVLEHARVITPVADRECARDTVLITDVLRIQHRAPGIRRQRRVESQQYERTESVAELAARIDEVL